MPMTSSPRVHCCSNPPGPREVARSHCARDPLTGDDHRNTVVLAPDDAVLIVDSVFAMRHEYNDMWDYRI